jgi:hypothetical protein
VSNTAELLTALGQIVAGQTIFCNAGAFPGLWTISNKSFAAPGITITSTDPLDPAVLNYFEMANCAGITFGNIDFEVLLPAFYGWKFDTCDRITISAGVRCRSNSSIPADFTDVVGMRFFTCTNTVVEDGEFYHLNQCIQGAISTDTLVIRRNNLHDMNSDCIDIGNVSNVTVSDNWGHDWHTTAGNHPDFCQFTADCHNVTISGNLIERGAGNNTQGVFPGDGNHTNVDIDGNMVAGTGASGIRPISCTGVTVNNNDLITFVGGDPTTLLVQLSDQVTVTNNRTAAGALSVVTSTNVTQSGNEDIAAVSDQGAADIAAWRLLHPDVPV